MYNYKPKKYSKGISKKTTASFASHLSQLKKAAANNDKHGSKMFNEFSRAHANKKDKFENSSSFKYSSKDYSSSRKAAKSASRSSHYTSSKGFMSSDRKRHRSTKRNKRMENRYNSNKLLEYKRTPSKSKKRTLNGNCTNSGFLASSKHGSRHSIKDNHLNNSRDFYSDRRTKTKKYDKRSMSSGIRKAKDLYLSEDHKTSPQQTSSKKERGYYKKYEESMKKGSKSKKAHYPAGINYVFSQPSAGGVKVIKQHNIAKKHVDHKGVNSSFQYKAINDMLSSSSPKDALNQSASAVKRSSLGSSQLNENRRMTGFNAPPHKSRHQVHYRMSSSSNNTKMSDNRSSSMVHQSELTPLHSNCTKTVKMKNTNEDSLIGSNAYKVSTMENSIKKNVKKSLNLSSNQYHEYPTTTDWHSSLVNPTEENVEELHHCFVMLYQKKRRIIDKIEKVKKAVPNTNKKSKRRTKRSGSAKRRREHTGETTEDDAQYEYITQKNSNVELCVQDIDLF